MTINIPCGGTLQNPTYYAFQFHLNPDNMPADQAIAQAVMQTARNFIRTIAYVALTYMFFSALYQKFWEL